MLDYYGSIVKSNEEIDTQLISRFQNECYEKYIEDIIKELRKDDVLFANYSVSGWNTFGYKQISLIIKVKIEYKKEKNERILKTYYTLNNYFIENNLNDYDLIKYIITKLL